MQTATESINLRSVQGQLEDLKSSIAAVTASEAALLKKQAQGLVSVRHEMTRREEIDAEKLNSRILEIAVVQKHAINLADTDLEVRRAKIHLAYHNSRTSLSRRMQEMKDRRIGQVQGSIMRNRKARQEELDRAKTAHLEFQKQLGADRGVRRELRESILKTFRSFRPVVKDKFEGLRFKVPAIEAAGSPEQTRAELLKTLEEARAAAEAAKNLALVRFFRFVPLWLLMAVVAFVNLWSAIRHGYDVMGSAFPSALISEMVLVGAWLLVLALSMGTIRRAATALGTARLLEAEAEKKSAARVAELEAEIQNEHDQEGRGLSETFRESDTDWKTRLSKGQKKLDQQLAGLPARLEKLHQRKLAKIAAEYDKALSQAQAEAQGVSHETSLARATSNAELEKQKDASIQQLTTPWKGEVTPQVQKLVSLEQSSRSQFPPWSQDFCENWTPPDESPCSVRIGSIQVDAAKLAGGLPHDPRFELPVGSHFAVPFALSFPDQGSVMIESDGKSGDAATLALNAISTRLLASHPPGRASFVFIDPVGLGKDFAGLMHLADYEETLINHRIWTQSTQIEERLAELNEHIEKVIQMYLRNEYATIAEYNEQAGTIAEKYRFVVVSGFPAGFSDTSMKRLLSIASSGARCGVYLLIHRDTRQSLPDTALNDELQHACTRLILRDGVYHLAGAPVGADVVEIDPAPSHENSITLIHRIGRSSIDSNRVQVPFSHITPPADEYWKFDTSEELRVPIGRTGAKKLQMLAIGKGTRQHALVAGKTGSGKSTLFHVIITNLALWCSPEQVEFYLVDFKKGVEFKCYATKHLPHARVIAIESDRQFALSVLQRVDAELKRRGELFRKAGSQDLAGYKRTPNHEPLPRSLLLIDEFQEFFTEDDAVAQEASLLLDRIVRQGRAFGIHVILGSQTLGGAYTLARATLGQMVIRVALQCNETDAHLIMDDDNPAPRLLTRPGEGIYNDQAGALAANSPFQIVWLPEDERDAVLDQVTALAKVGGKMPPPPIIFEGNAPADIRDHAELDALLRSHPTVRPTKARAWLGAPNSIKGPTEALFQRQSGSHLLAVGQSAERTLTLLAVSLVSLAAQYPLGQVEFVVLDPHAHEAEAGGIFQRLADILPHRIRVGGPDVVAPLMAELAAGLAAREASLGRDAPEVFLIIHDLQRFKSLRPEDDFRFSMDDDSPVGVSPSQAFSKLLDEGGPVGMHVLAATDTWNNVSRWIPRKLMAEFEMRVLFQMSANDSSNLIDSAAATSLGLHRALFHNEHLGTLETFRPYAMPDDAWFDEIAAVEKSSGSAGCLY
ncbi:MAG: FtsK/SpoIIIE domain-containing protein [Luteolibacter sp.]